MKNGIKNVCFFLIFCLIFICVSGMNMVVFADPLGINLSLQSGYSNVNGKYIMDAQAEISNISDLKYSLGTYTADNGIKLEDKNKKSASALLDTVRGEYCKKFLDCAEKNYEDLEFIEPISIKVGSDAAIEVPITTTDFSSYLDIQEDKDERIAITAKINGTSYTFYTYTPRCIVGVREITDADGNVIDHEEIWGNRNEIDNYSFCSHHPCTNSDKALIKSQWNLLQNTKLFLNELGKAARLGVIAGSVGSGYNVGTVYSDKQISLKDAMVETSPNSNRYDFKSGTATIKSTFDFYMNPLLGKVDFLELGVEIPKTLEKWTSFIDTWSVGTTSDFVVNTKGANNKYSIILEPAFSAFALGLDTETINAQGYKIDKNLKMRNGVEAVPDVGQSKKPESVLNYNMRIALPFIFTKKSGGKYSLEKNHLRIVEDLVYCTANDGVYKTDSSGNMTLLGGLDELELNRENIYLYKHQYGSDIYGVVLICHFREGVYDANTGRTYATGRNIGFGNSYSNSLPIDNTDNGIMYSIGSEAYTRGSVAQGISPYKFAFLLTDDSDGEEAKLNEYKNTMAAWLSQDNKSVNTDLHFIPVGLSNSDLFAFLADSNSHSDILKSRNLAYFKVLIGFVESEKVDPSSTVENVVTDEVTFTGFVIYRNNYYVNDAELLSWLRTSTVDAVPYVNADELIKKITGDFLSGMEKLTYGDWLKMQEIKSELQYQKDNMWVRVFNVVSIVLGTFLIVFAVILCLSFWIDIFNTFSSFSILYFVSFGNLYPVEDKDNMPYISQETGVCKFVTFPQLLVIAGIMCAIGVLFLNVNSVVALIVRLYYFILYLFTFV